MAKDTYTFSSNDVKTILEWKEKIKNHLSSHIIFNLSTSKNCFLMGGSFSSHYHQEKINDYDIFIIRENSGYDLSYDTLLAKFQNLVGNGLIQSPEYTTNRLNPHIQKVFKDPISNIQYIFTDYTSREDILKDFDMLHCCVTYDINVGTFHIAPEVMETIKNKYIIQNSQKDILKFRINKMIGRGWTLPDTKPTVLSNQSPAPVPLVPLVGNISSSSSPVVDIRIEIYDTDDAYVNNDRWREKIAKEVLKEMGINLATN